MKDIISKKLVVLTCIIIGLLVMPACAEDFCITRNAPDSIYTGQSFDVTLDLNGLRAGGIIETVPSGLSFVSTTFPDERYELEGQHLIFSVINDESISYTLKAESSGTATIAGNWDNALTKQNGIIENTAVAVYVDSGGDDDDSDSTPATSTFDKDKKGTVTKAMHLKSADQHAVLDIPKGIRACDKDGKAIDKIDIVHVGNTETASIKGTEMLFEKHVYRCSPAGATFSSPITLSFVLTTDEWNSLPKGKVFEVQNYNPEQKKWIALETTVDKENQTICAGISHFSIFGLFAVSQTGTQTTKPTEDITSQNNPTTTATNKVVKSDTTTPATPDEAAENSDMNPLFFGVLLIVVIIAIAAILLTGKNKEKKE